MAQYEKHLYLVLYPNEALVASQLSPEAFAKHYSVGSLRHVIGKVIFAEIDVNYRDPHDYLRIDEYLRQTQQTDGPKRTKFVKSYRVLEHIDFSALKRLYLVTTGGAALGLDKSEEPLSYDGEPRVRVYQELAPLQLLVASNLDPPRFGCYITEESWSKGAPKIFFCQYDIDVEGVVATNGIGASMGVLPNVNPSNLPNALKELQQHPDKTTKTISLNPNLDAMSYKAIRPGFWFADGLSTVFYRMPTMDELHEKHYAWWREL